VRRGRDDGEARADDASGIKKVSSEELWARRDTVVSRWSADAPHVIHPRSDTLLSLFLQHFNISYVFFKTRYCNTKILLRRIQTYTV
jgi:hypothetical protein